LRINQVVFWMLLLVVLLPVAALGQNRVDEWVGVRINGNTIADRAAGINGKSYLPLATLSRELGVAAEYDARSKTVVVTTPDGLRIDQLKARLDEVNGQLVAAKGDLATARERVDVLTAENQKLCRLVETANYFGYSVRCLGRSIEYNDARLREANQYWGTVTFCGQDLLVIPPSRGGGNDASGVLRAREIAEVLNGIFSSTNRDLRPEFFAQTTTGTVGARYAIAYRDPKAGDYKTICEVDPRYGELTYNWLKKQERELKLPEEKRLRTPKQAEELLRDWWLAELRDLVSLLRRMDYAPASTTQTKDAAEIYRTVLGPRLEAQYPVPQGDVTYAPLAVMNILNTLSPEEKLKAFDIFHEGGLLSYFTLVWTPSR
jgi:hypothetical protein